MNAIKILRAIELLIDLVSPAVDLGAAVVRLVEARKRGESVTDDELQDAIDSAREQASRLGPP